MWVETPFGGMSNDLFTGVTFIVEIMHLQIIHALLLCLYDVCAPRL